MLQQANYVNVRWIVFLCFILLSLFSCGPQDIYKGVYRVEGEHPAKHSMAQIELKEKGMGVWRVHNDEASFRWDVKDSEIWLSTKLGGIIIGKIQGGFIEITLPGSKTMSFKRDI
jgi:hypothetical protein